MPHCLPGRDGLCTACRQPLGDPNGRCEARKPLTADAIMALLGGEQA